MHTDIFFNTYDYKFITKIQSGTNQNVPELFYTFKSTKTGKTYHVHIELYPNHFYGIKFHLKDHKNNPNKYNIMLNYNEARPVIYTCIKIMLDINKKDLCSSFGFIGSNTTLSRKVNSDNREYYEKMVENKSNTKRFNVYRRLMVTFFKEQTFEHIYNEEFSVYFMVRRTELTLNPKLIDEISTYFSDMYSNFD